MKKILTFVKYRTIAVIRKKKIDKVGIWEYAKSTKNYAGNKVLNVDAANLYLKGKIESGKPFMATRFGATELLNMRAYDFKIRGKYSLEYYFKQLCIWSGFFPEDYSLCGKFVETMKKSTEKIDFLAIWYQPFEDYYINKLIKNDIYCTYLLNFEPWVGNIHWSAALRGKRVLVIHPFTETIEKQYMHRLNLFPDTDILPEFELKTLKAVQTAAGNRDERFETWFEALNFMYQEAIKIEFDIAIIGCGAYGMPLAAKIKDAGFQAIHLGGATQLLFGIKGKRWDEREEFSYIRHWYNENWVYPAENEKIENSNTIENSCYW